MHSGKALIFLYLTKCITANTTTNNRRVQRDAVAACQNLTSPTSNDGTTTTTEQFPDPSCWDTLDMSDWMTKWNSSTTVCTTTQNARTPCQCRVNEPWATCFMRLTYARNETARYACTDLTKPNNCTLPVPDIIVPGPAEIFYGAYSIWTIFHYLNLWYDVLTSPGSLPAITAQLSNSKNGGSSASHLLVALVQNYAVDTNFATNFVSILTAAPIVDDSSASSVRPTQSNVQLLVGQLLQQVVGVVMTDWACGDFQTMAGGGMLLNGTTETKKLLLARLGQQE